MIYIDNMISYVWLIHHVLQRVATKPLWWYPGEHIVFMITLYIYNIHYIYILYIIYIIYNKVVSECQSQTSLPYLPYFGVFPSSVTNSFLHYCLSLFIVCWLHYWKLWSQNFICNTFLIFINSLGNFFIFSTIR